MHKKFRFIPIFIITLLVLADLYTRSEEASAIPTPTMIRLGQASWYSEQDKGMNYRTANNEIFNDTALTCAIWRIPFHREIKVTNLANGKSIVVRVNDRGPHKRFVRKGRLIDLTKTAFQKIADTRQGLIDVQIEFL